MHRQIDCSANYAGFYSRDLGWRFALWGSSSGVNSSSVVVPGGGYPRIKVNAAAARKCSSSSGSGDSRQIDGGVPGELGNSPSTRALPRRSLSCSCSRRSRGITHARVNSYTRRTTRPIKKQVIFDSRRSLSFVRAARDG